jgi:hypothetical protein
MHCVLYGYLLVTFHPDVFQPDYSAFPNMLGMLIIPCYTIPLVMSLCVRERRQCGVFTTEVKRP